MKKLWNTLVVLGILLCMLMSLGVSAEAAEGDYAVLAVKGELTLDQISALRANYSGSILLAVEGSSDAQAHMGYDVVCVAADPVTASDVTYIWPGEAKRFTSMPDHPVVLVGVGDDATPTGIADAIANCGSDGMEKIIAVASASAAAKVDEYNNSNEGNPIQLVLIPNGDGAENAANTIAVKAQVVGKDGLPITQVLVNVDGVPQASGIAAPVIEVPTEEPQDMPDEENPDGEPQGEDTTGETDPGIDPGMIQGGVGPQIGIPTVDDPGVEPQINDDTGDGGDNVDVIPAPGPADEPDDGIGVGPGGNPIIPSDNIVTLTFKNEGNEDAVWEAVMGTAVYLPADTFAKEGYTLTGWTAESDNETFEAGAVYLPEGDETFTAVWTENAAAAPAEFTVTYSDGAQTPVTKEVKVTAEEGGSVQHKLLTLEEAGFATPENQTFAGWKIGAADGVTAAGETVEVKEDLTITAVWKNMVKAKITYKANNGTEVTKEDTTEAFAEGGNVKYVLLSACPEEFTAPEGQEFDGWKIGEAPYAVSSEITVSGDTEVLAVWKEVKVDQLTDQDPGATTAGEVAYTQGDATSKVSLSYTNAAIQDVFVDNNKLVLSQDYELSGDGKTMTFISGYLNKLPARSDYPLVVTFAETEEAAFKNDERTLNIKEAPKENVTKSLKLNWDRTQNMTINFADYGLGNPSKIEFWYWLKDANGNNTDQPGWIEMTKGTEYDVNGSVLTIYSAFANKSAWAEGTVLSFRVTVADSSTGSDTYASLTLTLSGAAASPSPTSAPTPTPANGASPLTGDNNNIVLYIVLLIVLIAALATVLIVVARRRRR